MEGEDLHKLENRVLIVAPFGRDAAETCRVLGEAGFEAVQCADAERLCAEIARSAAAAVVAEEALSDEDRQRLSAVLAEQPAWSDFPLLVMTSQVRGEGDGWHVLRGIEGTAHLTLLERPLGVPTLVSAVRAAVESRRRQYQVRDELASRQRAEEAARRQKSLLDGVMRATDVMLVLLDPQFNFVWVNPAYAEACRRKPEELIGKNHFDLYPHAENEAIFRNVRDTGEEVFFKDKPFVFPDQPERGVTYWDWSLAPVRDAGGEVTGLVFSLRETTRFKEAEEARRRSESRYRQLFESMSEGFLLVEMVYDEAGQAVSYRFLDANPALDRLTHLKRKEVIGKDVREVLPGIERYWIDAFGRVAATGEPTHLEQYAKDLDGWYDAYAYCPEPGHVGVIYTNVTERKRAERALRESREDLARAQEVGQIGSWRLDVRRNVLTWSEQNYRIFGVPQGTPMTYEAFLEIVPPEDRKYVDRHWRAALRGEPYDIQHRIVADGRVKWVREKAFLEFDESGNVLGGFGITQDVTDRRVAEEALRDLNANLEAEIAARTAVAEGRARALRRLARELNEAEHRERTRLAKLLHDDLQQLLLAAKLRLPVLAEGDPDQIEEHVGKIDELLGTCLITSRNLSHELSPPILQCGTLSEVMDWLAEWFGEKHGLAVVVDVPAELCPVPEHLRVFFFQAAREMLTNVAKHSGSMEARVELRCDYESLTVQIEDEGDGFDPDAIELHLERPEGFGLFNIQERLEAFGGRLEMDNTPRGGARFRMIVPVVEVAGPAADTAEVDRGEAAAMVPPARRSPDGAVRLLVVDDHAVVREGFVGLLGLQPDFEVIAEADDGQQAVEQAEALRPDAILMDVDMPTMNGVEATRRIKGRQPGVVIVGLSLHDEEGVARAMLEAGADAYISKNSPGKDVVEAVRRAWRRQERETL